MPPHNKKIKRNLDKNLKTTKLKSGNSWASMPRQFVNFTNKWACFIPIMVRETLPKIIKWIGYRRAQL